MTEYVDRVMKGLFTTQGEKFDKAFASFMRGCVEIYDGYMAKNFPDNPRDAWRIDEMKKYIRIVGGGSVYCFVQIDNGDVLKSASFAKPAKTARGNIFAPDNGLSRMGPYGAAYNR